MFLSINFELKPLYTLYLPFSFYNLSKIALNVTLSNLTLKYPGLPSTFLNLFNRFTGTPFNSSKDNSILVLSSKIF
jgi:hypothetical protein